MTYFYAFASIVIFSFSRRSCHAVVDIAIFFLFPEGFSSALVGFIPTCLHRVIGEFLFLFSFVLLIVCVCFSQLKIVMTFCIAFCRPCGATRRLPSFSFFVFPALVVVLQVRMALRTGTERMRGRRGIQTRDQRSFYFSSSVLRDRPMSGRSAAMLFFFSFCFSRFVSVSMAGHGRFCLVRTGSCPFDDMFSVALSFRGMGFPI